MTRIILIFFIYILTCVSLSSCGGSGDTTSSGTYSYTLGDLNVNYPNGTYTAKVFEGTSFNASASVGDASAMTTSNSVTILSLTTGIESAIYVWIDSTGGSPFVSDYYMYSTVQADFPGEYGVSTSGQMRDVATNANRDVHITSASNVIGTARVIWLPAGSLVSDVNVSDLYSSTGRNACNHIVGFAEKIVAGSSDFTVVSADYTLPLLTSYFAEDIYTLIVLVDTNGNEVRDSGDWEGINTLANNNKDEIVDIIVSQITK